MNEELVNLTTEETIDINTDEIIESEVEIENFEQDIEVDEDIEIIEAETVEEIEIPIEESVGWNGGDSTRHYSLYGRDESDQHPITAITGLREELNDIEALDVVYSNERNQANYYLWEDGNILQENRVGYFVSVGSDINEIKLCTSDNDIFGVTVDGAGFIGAQADVARDISYGLVMTIGIAHVRCELSVNVGDYVISNDYGYAQKNKTGYKVIGRHQIDGVEYAEIMLVTPIDGICKLSDEVDNLNDRMDDAETNIVAAINVANAAYNKAEETGNVSADAIKSALEALELSNDALGVANEVNLDVAKAKEMAEQAKAISAAAELAADNIRNEAIQTANNALSTAYNTKDELGAFVKEMSPLAQWEDENGSGIIGFIARANADSATLATLAEWKEDDGDNQSIAGTISKVNDHESILNHITSHQGVNGSTIAQVEQKADDNEASITSIVASVDKYSVGEYSQAYGLTRAQAKSILKPGYVYIPTAHGSTQSHSEVFVDETEQQSFTSGNYYVWNGSDWEEHTTSVIFQFSPPANSNNTYKYWYLNATNPMSGYEAFALYVWENKQWKKVNTLAGNASNRAVSMLRQTTNEIAAEVTDARGSYTGLSARLEADNKAQTAMVASVVDKNGKVTAASIINAVNNDKSSVAITADHIVLNGYTSNANGSFQIDTNGYMIAQGGTLAGWTINGSLLKKDTDMSPTVKVDGIEYKHAQVFLKNSTSFYHPLDTNQTKADDVLVIGLERANGTWDWPFNLRKDGTLTCTRANISGKITATSGSIGGWLINSGGIHSNTSSYKIDLWNPYEGVDSNGNEKNTPGKWIFTFSNKTAGTTPFYITKEGKVVATNAVIKGQITATSGTFDKVTINSSCTVAGSSITSGVNGSNITAGTINGARISGSTLTITNGSKIAGWNVGSTSLTSGTLGSSNSVHLYTSFPESSATTIGGYKGSNWRLIVGNKFGVDKYGNMYCTGGTIGGWNISGSYLYSPLAQHDWAPSGYYGQIRLGVNTVSYGVTTSSTTSPTGWTSAYWSMIISHTNNSVSDKRLKKDIESYSDNYDQLFDLLNPIRYKYIDGTSDRYHTGFIAQEVVDAIEQSNLTTQDFAAVMLCNEGKDDEKWMLRRDEFVALNTWQIQKLKARTAELENKVAELETLIKGE